MEVLHCGNRDFLPFGSCDLEPDPMTFIHKLEPYSLEIYWMCKNELKRKVYLKLSLDRQTDTTKIIYHAASQVVKTTNQYKLSVLQSLMWGDANAYKH